MPRCDKRQVPLRAQQTIAHGFGAGGIHTYRVVGCDSDHFGTGCVTFAGAQVSQGKRQTGRVPQQPETNRFGLAIICGRQ